jgi:hypothetical protein
MKDIFYLTCSKTPKVAERCHSATDVVLLVRSGAVFRAADFHAVHEISA